MGRQANCYQTADQQVQATLKAATISRLVFNEKLEKFSRKPVVTFSTLEQVVVHREKFGAFLPDLAPKSMELYLGELCAVAQRDQRCRVDVKDLSKFLDFAERGDLQSPLHGAEVRAAAHHVELLLRQPSDSPHSTKRPCKAGLKHRLVRVRHQPIGALRTL